MINLSLIHVSYLVLIVIFLIVMACKKSIVIPCALGIVFLGAIVTRSPIGAIQTLFNALVWAGSEFLGIIVVIALVVAMSRSLISIGADRILIFSLRHWMGGPRSAFFILGVVMFVVSICVWPSPAVALVGTLLLPMAVRTGMPVLWAAVVMNIFGHGMALSGDFFIQGAPTITAKAAGTDVGAIMSQSVPLWAIMCVVTAVAAFLCYCRDMRAAPVQAVDTAAVQMEAVGRFAPLMAVLTPVVYLGNIAAMLAFKLQGGDATALVGGSALLLLVLCACLDKGVSHALDDVGDYLKEGFGFSIKIFAPVIVIGGFFFLGGEGGSQAVFGSQMTGILSDIGEYIAENVPVNRFSAIATQAAVAVITGLDGSGFSGLPLVGATAKTFADALPLNKEVLASMGQIITIWVGGGTLIPWAVVPVAAICDVSPVELVRKNFVPVICGLVSVAIATFFLL
ncbi:hypothetical protein [Oscillibacter sp. GMB15532]|uniref:hypothetical protein n=1 Tax=Oscillibacter sp. GMB15532 TaxID=3230022 RepID=UPI0034E0516C